MEIKEISAEPLKRVWENAKNLTQEELKQIDIQMRQIETAETFMAIEWGYRFYVGCLPDENGVKGYQKLGYDTEEEWIRSFKCTTRRTAYNKRKVYEIWATHLHELPIETFFEVGYSKILVIRHEIEKHSGNREKLKELIEEASALFRHQLLQKYRDKPPRLYWTATLDDVIGKRVVLSDFESKFSDKLFALKGYKIKGYFELIREDFR